MPLLLLWQGFASIPEKEGVDKYMERKIDMAEISDGKLYGAEDMVKADCGDCEGCSACCQGMGDSILLDPYDICRLSEGLGKGFEELMKEAVGLRMADGLILPYLKMTGDREACFFLDSDGRCSVHPIRPGFCRLFPLGRFYENGSFRYFLQTHECRKENRTKVRVRKWVDTPDFAAYEQFINDWHYTAKELGEKIRSLGAGGQAEAKKLCLYILNRFYMEAYEGTETFFEEFYRRLEDAGNVLGLKNTIKAQERIKQG